MCNNICWISKNGKNCHCRGKARKRSRKITLKPHILRLSQVLILKFSQHNPYPNRISYKRKRFSKIQSKRHFIQTVIFKISKFSVWTFHYRKSWNPFKILKSLTSVRRRRITCQWLFTLTSLDYTVWMIEYDLFWKWVDLHFGGHKPTS